MREVGGQSRGSNKDSQKDADLGSTLGAAPAARSADSSEVQQVPHPARGILFRQCCVCKARLEPVAVALDDPANGMTSHGYCLPCEIKTVDSGKAMRLPAVVDPPSKPPIVDGFAKAFLVGLSLWPMDGGMGL